MSNIYSLAEKVPDIDGGYYYYEYGMFGFIKARWNAKEHCFEFRDVVNRLNEYGDGQYHSHMINMSTKNTSDKNVFWKDKF